MNQTKHFKMVLPNQDDFYDIEVFNENMRQIDRVLNELRWKALSAQPRQKQLVATYLTSGTFRPADFGLEGAAADIYMVGAGAQGNARNGRWRWILQAPPGCLSG